MDKILNVYIYFKYKYNIHDIATQWKKRVEKKIPCVIISDNFRKSVEINNIKLKSVSKSFEIKYILVLRH
jgi:hypothetical protein